MRWMYTLLMLGALSAGCCNGELIRASYVSSDSSTYDAIAPYYMDYLKQDASLSEEERERRARTVTTWKIRVEAAKAANAETTPEGGEEK